MKKVGTAIMEKPTVLPERLNLAWLYMYPQTRIDTIGVQEDHGYAFPGMNNNNNEDLTMKHLFRLSVFVLLLDMSPVFADQASDREEIETLLWRYTRALDTLDADAYLAVFTEDGQFDSGSNSSKGHAALRAMIDGVKKSQAERAASTGQPSPPMFHMTTDSWIEFVDADHARHHSYWLTVFGATGAGTVPNVAAAGRGVDELVRIDGRWLIQSRNVAPQD